MGFLRFLGYITSNLSENVALEFIEIPISL